MGFQSKVIAEFRCFDDHIELTQTDEHMFRVDNRKFKTEDRTYPYAWMNINLRTARIVFEKHVNEAICRMTLERMYGEIGQTPPRGSGKYGLPE